MSIYKHVLDWDFWELLIECFELNCYSRSDPNHIQILICHLVFIRRKSRGTKSDATNHVKWKKNGIMNWVLSVHLATASSLSKNSASTIEISSITRCLQDVQCCSTPGRWASSIHCSRGAEPEPIPDNKKNNNSYTTAQLFFIDMRNVLIIWHLKKVTL